MDLKKILLSCLILMILSITAANATDLDDVNATDSVEPIQEIEPIKEVEHDTNLQPISEKKPIETSNFIKIKEFAELEILINWAEDGSVIDLTRDYRNMGGYTIHINKNLTIDGHGHTLDCLGEVNWKAFFSSTGNIVLKNIRIINGYNNFRQGGAIEIVGDAQYTLENCIFENNFVDGYGGAIFNGGKTLTIINCTFNGNTADDESGGAIYSISDVIIYNSTFINNKADDHGGAVYVRDADLYIDNCTFKNNNAGYGGGAVSSNRVYINTNQSENRLFNTYFIGNTVSNSAVGDNNGGAVYVYSGGRIVNTCFRNNKAKVDGGAIYADEYSTLGIDHCLFEENSATGSNYQCYGGAICSESDVYIHNSTFKDNYADDYGGAIYAKNVRINADRESETADTFFINNKAKDNDGGAIYAENDVFARNTAFISNSVLVDGGAIYAKNNVEVICSIFESNQATGASVSRCYGGAIRAEENAKINNCTFKNNHADNRGGAVHASTVTIEGERSTFEGNSANDYGGAIYTDTFTNDVSHASFINNGAGDGGAAYINNENEVTFTDCAFINNRASNKGGAIYMDSRYSHISIINNAFIGNSAAEGNSVYTYGYYDEVSGNYWTVNPTEYNNQLVEWKAVGSNVQHTDSNPVTFTLDITEKCFANLTSGITMSFVHQDGTAATLPVIAEMFTIYGIEGIEIEDKEVSADGITIWFKASEVGTYELTAYLLGMTATITINVIDGGAIVPVPLPEDDIIRPDIPKPYIPVPHMTTIKE